jgi:Raf kinase inhibitor-like YbhB/YbcL family protein
MTGAEAHRPILAIASVAMVSFSGAAANAAGILTLESAAFQDGKMMPQKTANSRANVPNNANCIGENISPQLSWSNVPDGTKSFILLVNDPQAGGGAGFSHLVAYGIPVSVTSFAEGELSKPSDKYVGGKSGFGTGIFGGPCAPPNTSPHHFVFVLIATDFDPKDLPPGLTRDEVLAKLISPGQPPAHTKGTTSLVGLFVNPWHP